MANEQFPGKEKYIESFQEMGRSARLEPSSTSEDDHLAFAAKMKEKAWDRPREAQDRERLASMSSEDRNALMMKIMLEEAQLSKGLTKEQNQHRIKMEKLGWEQEDRAELKMHRWFDCEKPQGTLLQVCACRQPNIAYCSSECQKLDWKLQHKNMCSARVKKSA